MEQPPDLPSLFNEFLSNLVTYQVVRPVSSPCLFVSDASVSCDLLDAPRCAGSLSCRLRMVLRLSQRLLSWLHSDHLKQVCHKCSTMNSYRMVLMFTCTLHTVIIFLYYIYKTHIFICIFSYYII